MVEMVFGRLKARWRRLNKKIDMLTMYQMLSWHAAYYTMFMKFMVMNLMKSGWKIWI